MSEAPDVEVRPAAGIVAEELDGEIVMVHPATQEFFVLNETASATWNVLLAEPSLTRACETIAATFDVPLAQVADDVGPLLERLIAAGLLTVHPVDSDGRG